MVLAQWLALCVSAARLSAVKNTFGTGPANRNLIQGYKDRKTRKAVGYELGHATPIYALPALLSWRPVLLSSSDVPGAHALLSVQ
jgi:hypothetical protein